MSFSTLRIWSLRSSLWNKDANVWGLIFSRGRPTYKPCELWGGRGGGGESSGNLECYVKAHGWLHA